MKPEQFTKHNAEKYPITIDWTGQLPGVATIASGTASAIEVETGRNATTEVLLSSTATIAGSTSKITVQAGQATKNYKITVKIVLSDASILVEEILMKVI